VTGSAASEPPSGSDSTVVANRITRTSCALSARAYKHKVQLRHPTNNGGANSGGASDDGANPSDDGANPSGGVANPSGGGAKPQSRSPLALGGISVRP
jgi:hypothetical protein